jgi:DNA-binding MarR family transcriptional regulator
MPESSKTDSDSYSAKAQQLEQLARELHQNFYLLKNMMLKKGVFEDLGSGGGVILSVLTREGPHSIPQLLQVLPTSRQYIQKEVSKLVKLGLVDMIHNPAHKSSKLLAATEQGRHRHINRRERLMNEYSEMESDFTAEELSEGLKLLKKLGARLTNCN